MESNHLEHAVERKPSFGLAKNLKLLKKDIRLWIKEVFGGIEVKMWEIMIKVGE